MPFNCQGLEDEAATQGRTRYISEQYAVRRHWVRRILKMFGVPPDAAIRDCFATEANKRFERCYTFEDDALSQRWRQDELLWMNPPWSLWPLVARKISGSTCTCICVLPAWDSQPWVQSLWALSCKFIYMEVGTYLFELAGKRVGGIRWGAYALYISNWQPSVKVGMVAQVPQVPRSAATRRRWRRRLQREALQGYGPLQQGNVQPTVA